ncbi:leucine aminopeptidase 2 [Trichomonascus vanleenenianus]|uniref:bifunctional aminopeptidase/epoxide hydrolase n=1 Tax=Trichomonascus vanleenenianus TaxID=2268995 RepID=UPI003ECB080A
MASSTLVESSRPQASPALDPSTLSNYSNFSIAQTDLSYNINWASKTLHGLVRYSVDKTGSADKFVLDSSFLDIHSARVNGEDAKFELSDRIEPLGAALTVTPASGLSTKNTLEIEFSTTDKCTAIQWLNKEQTAGQKAPYLFSQCQAIHARSLFPCFDTPSVKSKYNFTLQSLYPALSSGNVASESDRTPEPLPNAPEGSQVFRFVQHMPIPSYLVCIASGDLDSANIGPRSQVYTEPSKLDACKWEFEADTENIIQAAEKVVFPYEWKTYNVLVLPPSFPYGGMENPNITFATPTLISGDRENVHVIAHELAHSWSGNLVTNCSWEHFWLNEGWTVYLERRILGALHGEEHRHFHAIIGWKDLENAMVSLGDNFEKYSKLVVNLQGHQDPDDAFSTVPYEKGFNFLFYLENLVGGKAEFDPFIPYYFGKFKGKSLDSYQFKDTLYEFFSNKKALLDSIDWDSWYFNSGLPPKPKFDTTIADECYDLANRWVASATIKSQEELHKEFSAKDIASWTSTQSVVFLDSVADGFEKLSGSTSVAASALNEIYSFGSSHNPEVISRWYRLAIGAQLESQYALLAKWLGTVGRMKFVRPGFKLLNKVDRPLALKVFEQNRSFYHPICRAMVVKDLGL